MAGHGRDATSSPRSFPGLRAHSYHLELKATTKTVLRGGDDPCLSSTRQRRTVVMKRDSGTVASTINVASPVTPVIALQTCDFSVHLRIVLQEQTQAVSLG